ncbi:MAG: hypothetical protein AAF415_00490 [Pseudomonadota bacterium]
MIRQNGKHLLFALGLGFGSLTTQPALAFNDPDWPCVQRKVVQLSIGQMWTAPLPPEGASWRDDADIARLAPLLAARRTTLEEAETMIAEFAEGADRDARLTLLFDGIFSIIERDRRRLIDGITRYALKQRALSEKIDADQAEVAALKEETAEDDFDALDKLEEREDQLVWDTRIYQDRNKSLTYVCESPVLLEKRAFALAQLIQAQLKS